MLEAYELLDSDPEPVYDELVELAAELCNVPMVAIALLGEDRSWYKAKLGFDFQSFDRPSSFCVQAIESDDVFVVENASKHPTLKHNAAVVELGIQFYAGVPVRAADGTALGVLCILDRRARMLMSSEARVLRALGRQVEALFEARLQVRRSERQMQVAARERDSLVSLVRKEEEHASLVVHDLKSPLTNILFSAQFLSEEAQDEEKREAAEGILSSVRHLHRLVMSLLDLGQAGDDVALKLETTDIGGVLHDVANEATTRLRALGREVRVRSELASTIDVDATMIRRVVENLVDNAIKYSRGTITLEARDHDGDIQIDVRDEGEGIPAGERVRVFERCKRLDRDVAIDRTSRGLGLAFCKLAVEAHGGRIWIDDNRPRGAVFHVRLPTAASRASGERFRAEVATTPKRRVAGK